MASRKRSSVRRRPKTYRAYVRELDGTRRFLGSLEGYRQAYGDTWVAKMRAHYQARLAALEAMDPPPVHPVRR